MPKANSWRNVYTNGENDAPPPDRTSGKTKLALTSLLCRVHEKVRVQGHVCEFVYVVEDGAHVALG